MDTTIVQQLQQGSAQFQAETQKIDADEALSSLKEIQSHLNQFFSKWENGGNLSQDLLGLHFHLVTAEISKHEWKALARACEEREVMNDRRAEYEYFRQLDEF